MRYLMLTLLCLALSAFAFAGNPDFHTDPVVVNAGTDTVIYKNQTRPDSIFLNGATSTTGQAYRWEQIGGPTSVQLQTPDAQTSWATGAFTDGFYQFRLIVNETDADTVTAFVRDWQKRGIYPCRPGYDTTAKIGGQKIVLEPNYKGSYIKPDGASGTWNQWNFITDVRGYIQSTKKTTLYGGDTLLMEGADSTVWVELGSFGGDQGCPVYVMPRTKPVHIRGTNAFFRIATRDSNVAQYVVVDGTALRGSGYPYGFIMDNSGFGYAGNGAFTGGWVAHFTLKGLHSSKTNAVKIKQDPTIRPYSRYDKWIQDEVRIEDNWIDSSSNEGMYIGSSASDGGQTAYGPPIRMQNVTIINNMVTNCKWDGIQLANAKTGNRIQHNFLYKIGTANQPSQRAGILLGGNSTGRVDSNLIVNSRGDGIQVFGYEAVPVTGNIIDSIYGGSGDQDGMYHSFIPFETEPGNTPLSIFNSGNLISRVERNMIRVANNNGQMLPGRTNQNFFIHPTATDANSLIITNVKGDVLENNTMVKQFPYAVRSVGTNGPAIAIKIVQADTTPTFNNIPAAVRWLFQRLQSVGAANTAPTVSAGVDFQTTLPADSVLLQGQASDAGGGTIVAQKWTQLSGPQQALIIKSDSARTWINGLVEGSYNFEFAATDNGNLTAKDTVLVTVLPQPNQPPVANAGADQNITLPANSVTLSGSGTDADGAISTFSWTKLSGPAQGTITSPTAATTTVTNLASGSYTFHLTVTDNRGATASDDVLIQVANAPVVATSKTINVNIYDGTTAYANSAWNNWSIRNKNTNNITSTAFKYSDGTTSKVTATLSNSAGVTDNGASYASGIALAPVLRHVSYSTGSRTLMLKGLTATKKYDIEFYASRNVNGSSTIFTINGVAQSVATYNNFTNKVSFTNLTPTSAGQIVVSISKSGSFNCLNGFAITEWTKATTTITKAGFAETAVEEQPELAAETITVYPNPVEQLLTVTVNSSYGGVLQIRLINASGRVIFSMQQIKTGTASTYNLPVTGLAKGLYIVELKMGKQLISKKIIKQ